MEMLKSVKKLVVWGKLVILPLLKGGDIGGVCPVLKC